MGKKKENEFQSDCEICGEEAGGDRWCSEVCKEDYLFRTGQPSNIPNDGND